MIGIINFIKKRKALTIVLVMIIGIILWKYTASVKGGKTETAKVEKGEVTEELVLSGQIAAEEHANLSFLSSGELNYVGVTDGQFVKKGDILAKLDSTNAYQTFLQAESDLARYKASLDNTYDQLQGHEKDESYSQIETRTIAESNKDKAYRNYVIAKKNLDNLVLRAPFDGIITSVTHPYNGINTSLMESQIEIINPTTIFVEVSADQTEVTKLKLNEKANIVLDSYPDTPMEGEIVFIGYTPKAGEIGTVYDVKVKLTSSVDTQKVRVGMTGDIKFVVDQKSDVLYLPPKFVKSDSSGRYVNLFRKNNKIRVETGIESEEKVEVKGDVKEGDIVYD